MKQNKFKKGDLVKLIEGRKTSYDIKLLVDLKDFKKGKLVKGNCSSKSDFSKFKKWFIETYTDGNHYLIAIDTNSVRSLYKAYFKEVEFTKLKVNPKDNTITIRKVKDNWNREELPIEELNIVLKHLKSNTINLIEEKTLIKLEEWIKNNL